MTLSLPSIAADQVVAFLLVLSRVGGLFALAPIFSARMIPLRAKLIAAGGIALALTPLASEGLVLPDEPVDVAFLIGKEVLVGLAFAFAIALIGAAVQMGAGLLDAIVGFSFAAIVDPVSNVSNAILGQLYALFVSAVFIAVGGDQVMIAGLARSYDVIPLDGFPSLERLGSMAADGFGQIFLTGLMIAAPAVIALVLVDAALGIAAKAVPQANVFIVGLPAKILVAFGVVAASLPFVANRLTGELELAVETALRAVGG
jgi:flagellar biosynthetic protein FliR